VKRLKVLLVYIGNEQGAWGSIAFPRPSHYYIMPGILYCAASLRKGLGPEAEIATIYLNRTVQTHEEMLKLILNQNPDLVGFSVYLWNRRESLALSQSISQALPGCSIICGGPEVGCNDTTEALRFFETHPDVDCLAFGEAEESLVPIVRFLSTDDLQHVSKINGFALNPRLGAAADFSRVFHTDSISIPSIYPLKPAGPAPENENGFPLVITRSANCGLAMVYETGRGCPYRCIYCLFSHRNHKPFRFDIERVAGELRWLLSKGIDCIHFADAVFDQDALFAKEVLRLCNEHNRCTSLFFYCSFTKLDDEMATLFEKSQAQICVGVQTTSKPVLQKIHRALSPHLFDRIRDILLRHPLNFYVDLIFGLPLDTFAGFSESVNAVRQLRPSFVMVFPLTMIRGTPLEQHAGEYGMQCYPDAALPREKLMCDIEYSNIALYKGFAITDLVAFDDVALTLFYFYHRFNRSLSYLAARDPRGACDVYQRIGAMTKNYLRRTGLRPTNSLLPGFDEEIKRMFIAILEQAGAGPRELAAAAELYKMDIFRILMLEAPQREKLFRAYRDRRDAEEPRSPLISDDIKIVLIAHAKVVNVFYSLSDLLTLDTLKEDIEPGKEQVLVSAPFGHWDAELLPVSSLQKRLLEIIPSDRPITVRQLKQMALRGQRGEDGWGSEAIEREIVGFAERDLVGIYA